MSFADVQNKTTLSGFSAADKATILAAMRTAYEGSATAKTMFDSWIAVPGKTITIDFLSGKFQAYPNTGKLEIDLNNLTQAMYINNNGTAVKDTAVTAIVHELVHALTGRGDNRNLIVSGATIDYRQPTVTFSNMIYKELGLPEQNSYIAYDEIGDFLTLNFQYTKGAAIDRSVVVDPLILNWDSSAAGNSKDLLIGHVGGNVLRAGDGNDFLYGNGGNDTLEGGSGNDTLYGGADADILTGGLGNDYLEGGSGNDTYKYTSGDGLDSIYDAGGQGSIVFDSATLAGGAQYGDARVHRDSNKHLYVQVDPKTLLIDGSLIVNNSSAFSPILGLSMTGAVADVNPVTGHDIIGDPLIRSATVAPGGVGTNWQVIKAYNHQYVPDGSGGQTLVRYDVDYFLVDSDRNSIEGGGPSRIDTLTDSTANDHILSAGNDDIINATRGGDDLIEAGAGRDNVFAGDGKDVILGGTEGDILDGGLGDDRIYANLQITAEQAIANGNSNASIAAQGDWLAGGSGDDTLIGSAARDVLSGGGGQDLLIGGAGDDDLMGDTDWVASDFTWTVTDQPSGTRLFQPAAGVDTPVDGAADVIYAGAGNDHASGGLGNDVIFGEGGSDKLSGNDGNDVILGGDDSDTLRGDSIEHAGDTFVAEGNDYLDGGAGDDWVYGDGGADYLVGGADNDTLDGGSGADIMAGGLGNDNYVVDDIGDVVIEAAGEGNDTVFSSINITQPDNVETLNLTGTANLDASGNAEANTLFGNTGANRLMGLAGADFLMGMDGNDALDGGLGDDTLNGGTGADSMAGGAGNDTYTVDHALDLVIEAAAEGSDAVFSSVSITLPGNIETITLTGIANTDATGNAEANTLFGNGGANRLLGLAGNDNIQGLDGNDSLSGGDGVDTLFGDAGVDTLEGGSGNDQLLGGADGDLLSGGADNDTLYGEAGNDTLDGGAGTDTLIGGAGNDTYWFGKGDGQDNIQSDYDMAVGKLNVLQFKAGVLPSEIVAAYSGNDLLLSIAGTTDQVRIGNFFYGNDPANVYNAIQQVKFSNGAIWDINALIAKVFQGTAAADSIRGTVNADTINGQAGADTLYGDLGNDTLNGGADNDMLFGEAGNDTLDGGAGNDQLLGGADNDIYLFGKGDGQDRINTDGSSMVGSNVLQFKPGVLPSEIVATRSADDLVLSIAGTTDKMTIAGFFYADNPANPGNPIQQVKFSDNTTWDINALTAKVFAGSAAADTIRGTANADIINGQAGADTLYGLDGNDTLNGGADNDALYGLAGNDILDGGAGDDTSQGGEGDDTLTGGLGNDSLQGGAGNDVYLFAAGDGADTLIETGGNADVLRFKPGITPQQVSLIRNDWWVYGEDSLVLLLLDVNGAATGDSIYMRAYFNADNDTQRVDRIEFAGGAVWTYADIQARMPVATANNDTLLGFAGADVIDGLGGDDVMNGKAGNDTLQGGEGSDILYGEAGNDSLNGGAGDDDVQGGLGDDTLLGGAGNDRLLGYDLNNGSETSNDVLYGGTGNDRLFGGRGNDTYLFGRGDGFDTVGDEPNMSGPSADVLRLSAGVLPQHVTLHRMNGNDLVVVIDGSSTQILLSNYYFVDYLGVADYSIERIEFDGGAGAVWTAADINARVQVGTPNNLTGTLANDTFIVDHELDTITEAANAGIDTVLASRSYTLPDNVDNLTLTGVLNINATGNALDNVLRGNSGDNYFTGNGGTDIAYGGQGNDTYKGVAVVEFANEGIDTYIGGGVLPDNVENMITESGSWFNMSTIGNALDNILTSRDDGVQGDILDGRGGADTVIIKGWNKPIVYIDNPGDRIIGGAYEIRSSIDYVLSEPLRFGNNQYIPDSVANRLVLLGNGAINGTGNPLNNVLDGSQNTAANTLTGGLGDDTYVIGVNDRIVEAAGGGNDQIQFWTFASDTGGNIRIADLGINNIESYVLAGYSNSATLWGDALDNDLRISSLSSGSLSGGAGNDRLSGGLGNDRLFGEDGADTLSGDAGADILSGGSGNDRLDGGTDDDRMLGGAGDDTYEVDHVADAITELANEGIDNVNSVLSYILGANLENLTLTGIAATNGTGNDLGNVLTGNAANNLLTGLAGDDTLNGGAGADTLIGGLGNDTYGVDNAGDIVSEALNEGVDTVQSSISYTLGTELENLLLTGTLAIDATGNTLNNVLTGNSGNNTLNGGLGNDTLIGGLGNDSYLIDNIGDIITEALNEGTDSIQSSLSYTLGANLENLTLTGTAALNGSGNALGNILTGNIAANTLNGGAGYDALFGGAGNDILNADTSLDWDELYGEAGDDVLNGQSTSFLYAEGGAGNDTINGSGGSDELYGDDSAGLQSGNDTLYGNNGMDYLYGGLGNDTLDGGADNDWLYGADGVDILLGGTGNDRLIGGLGADILKGGVGDDTYGINEAGDVVTELANEGIDSVNSLITYTLGANLENLLLTGTAATNGTGNAVNNLLTGNTANNTLTGLAGNDTLDGGVGADTLIGGIGNDTYLIDNTGDVITEALNEGIDTVQSSITTTLGANLENLTLTGITALNATGNALGNILTGNTGNNTLNGGAGYDMLMGGTGNDILNADTSLDWDELYGEAGDDVLNGQSTSFLYAEGGAGNDTLNGSNGSDELYGDDIYGLQSGNDILYGNNGTDYLMGGLGNDTLDGGADNDWLNGGEGIDTLLGGSGNDRLMGGLGADILKGGIGDDIYGINETGDLVTELANEGIDAVNSSISYTLGANLENLTLTGTLGTNGTGNIFNNLLTGNSANNTLIGSLGNDILQGGAGNDSLNDSAGNTLLNGGIGIDTLTGNTGNELFIGGTGNDILNTGTGYDLIAFNRGDGQDLVTASTGTDNTISIGGGIKNSDLVFSKSGNDLILATGSSEQITLQNWYSAPTNKSVLTLQMIEEAAADFVLGGTDPLRNNKVEQFNFIGLADRFDQARTANPALTSWSLTNALLDFHIGNSDTTALGGDLAYQYGKTGNLANVGLTAAQGIIGNAQFAQVNQALLPLASLQEGVVRLA